MSVASVPVVEVVAEVVAEVVVVVVVEVVVGVVVGNFVVDGLGLVEYIVVVVGTENTQPWVAQEVGGARSDPEWSGPTRRRRRNQKSYQSC